MTTSPTYYKVVRPDGTSFHDPNFRWVPETGTVEGLVVTHRLAKTPEVPAHAEAKHYLSVSAKPTECTGMSWPCRLLEVEPVDGYPTVTPKPIYYPNKNAAMAWRVVRELPAHMALGPHGEHVAALIKRASVLTPNEAERLASHEAALEDARLAAWEAAWESAREAARLAAWEAAWDAAWEAAREAARLAAWDAAWRAGWRAALGASRGAALALIIRGLIPPEHYDGLSYQWRRTIGRIHPDDVNL